MTTAQRLFLLTTLVWGCFATITNAQLTNNPYIPNVTNAAALASIGSDGFGVAVLGYPMPTPATNIFADNLDGVAVSDASTATDQVGMLQFYIANEDNFVAASIDAYNVASHRVLQSASNPNLFTVSRSFVASIQTNAPASNGSDGNAVYGEGCAGTFGLGGVTKNGTVVFRMDGSSAPASGMAGEAIVTVPAYTPRTIIMTDAVSFVDLNLTNIVKILAIDSNTGDIPQIGQNGLVVKNSFAGFSYVGRADINPANAGTLSFSSNAETIVTAPGVNAAGQNVTAFYTTPTWANRGMLGVNDTSKTLATFIKSAQDITTGGDAITGVALLKYTDSGSGPITPTSLTTNIFGASSAGNWPSAGITTNGTYFFSRSSFNGPSQISINDSGAVAFAVDINVDAANDGTNGTRAAQVTAIILQPAGASGFRFVTDNTGPLFYVPPVSCTNKNFISPPSLDNFNNLYFEAAYTHNALSSCDLSPSNAVYEAVANDPVNPTSWTVRILLRQGDTFVNPVTGDTIQVLALPYNAGPATKTISQRSLGPNAINRTQLPGHTVTNTTPASAFAFGGIVVPATITNLTRGFRSDALLYIAPYTAATNSCPTITLSPPSPLTGGTVGSTHNQTLSASGGTGPYTFSASGPQSSCDPVPSGLVAWWPGEGNANDIQGTNNGTLIGGATFAPGLVGQAFSLNGSSAYVQVPDSSLWTFGTNSFTIELWANFKSTATAFEPIVGHDPGGGGEPKWIFLVNNGQLTFHVNGGVDGAIYLAPAPFTPTVNQWYHLAVERNGNLYTIYINGVVVGSQINASAIPTQTTPLTIGVAEGNFFNGLLDEVSIYNRALSTSEIQAIYNVGSAGKCPSLNRLPLGLNLSSAGVLSGIPTAAGIYNFTTVATDANGCTGSLIYTQAICPVITLSPAGTLTGGMVGTVYNQVITASGGVGSYRYTTTAGTLPTGLILSPAGMLSGTSTVAGVYGFTVTATDTNGCAGSQAYNVTICSSITLSPGSTLTGGTAGTAYSQTFIASGGIGSYTYAVSAGTLSAGLALSPAGVLSGTPTAVGNYAFTVLAHDSNGCPGTRTYTLTIGCPTITLAAATLSPASAGNFYSQTITASGGTGPYTFTKTGTLPTGMLLSSGGTLSGMPTQTGTFPITITATDQATGCLGSRSYTVKVNCPAFTISPSNLPSGTVGSAYSATLTPNGGVPSYSFMVSSGSLPTGLNLDPSTGALSGAPVAAGMYTFTVAVFDANGCPSSMSYTVQVSCPPITLSPLPNGTVMTPYSQNVMASGATGPYTFSVLNGTLPDGLTLSTGGLLSGTPTTASNVTFTLLVNDAYSCSGTQQYTLAIFGSFEITAITKEGNDIRVTWSCLGSHSYVLQSTKAAAIASYTTNYEDISPVIVAAGSGATATNYLDEEVAYAPVLIPPTQVAPTSGVASTVNSSAQLTRGLADSLGKALPVGSLLMLGSFNISEASIQSNFFAGDVSTIMSNFTPYATTFAVGDGTGLPATWNVSRSAPGFGGQQIYLLVIDRPTLAKATHLGIFTAPSWIFPVGGGTDTIALEDITDFVIGTQGGSLTINLPVGGQTYTFSDTARLSVLPGRIIFYRVRLAQ